MKNSPFALKFILFLAIASSLCGHLSGCADDRVASYQPRAQSGAFGVSLVPVLVGGLVGCAWTKKHNLTLDNQLRFIQSKLRTPGMNRGAFNSLLAQEKAAFTKKSNAMNPSTGAKIGGFVGSLAALAMPKAKRPERGY